MIRVNAGPRTAPGGEHRTCRRPRRHPAREVRQLHRGLLGAGRGATFWRGVGSADVATDLVPRGRAPVNTLRPSSVLTHVDRAIASALAPPAGRGLRGTVSASPPETALVMAARSGDRAAFGALYVRYARMVHGVLLARVPRRFVDDLVQDVFLMALGR